MAVELKERAKRNGHAEHNGFDLGAVPDAAKRRRVPEIAAGLLVIAVCALGALWWQASGSAKQPVLAFRVPVERGDVIALEDLQVVGIDSDAEVAALGDTEASLVVGRTALSDLPAGALVVESMFADGSLIESGDGVVGLSLGAGEFPTLRLAAGDSVGVVLTPAAGDPRNFAEDVDATVLVETATVVEVATIGTQGNLFVSLQVGEADAARIASAASAGRVRLIQVAGVPE